MKYQRVHLAALGFELAPVVVSTAELEARLGPLYERLHIPEGQLEAITGITERRWWEPDTPPSHGAIVAARKALARSRVKPSDLEVLIYAAVCREHLEPATACRVAAGVGVSPSAAVYDITNACLGVLNGILDVANRIELGQIRAGLIVSCESAREIAEVELRRMIEDGDVERFKYSLTALTGGSGAVAVLLVDGSLVEDGRRRLVGGVTQAAPEHHALCRWGLRGPENHRSFFFWSDSAGVLRHGLDLGKRTWRAFLQELDWRPDEVDKVICHQVGAAHQREVLKRLEIPEEKDFPTYAYLGNTGTVALPLTAALADERDFLRPGDRVGFLGIGSGLNCLMLGWEW